MSATPAIKRLLAATLLAGAGALAGTAVAPVAAHADPGASGPHTWCPGQPHYFAGDNIPNWDWNICHTYYTVYGGAQGNVSKYVWEGPEGQDPPVPPGSISIPARNCGLFYCEYPGGRR